MAYGIEINGIKVDYNDGNLIYLETRYYDVQKYDIGSAQRNLEISVQSIIDYWLKKTGIKLKDVVILGDYLYPLATLFGNVFTTSYYENGKYKITIGNQGICHLYFYGLLDNNQYNYGVNVLGKQINPIQFFKKHKCNKKHSTITNQLIFEIPTEIKTQPSGFIARGRFSASTQYFWNNRLQNTYTYDYDFNNNGIDYLPITTDSMLGGNMVTYISANSFVIAPLEYMFGSEFGMGRSATIITSQDMEVWILEQIIPSKGKYGVELNSINSSINEENIHFSLFNQLKHLRFTLNKTTGKQYLPKSVNRLIYTGTPFNRDNNGYYVEFQKDSYPTINVIDVIYM